MSHVSASLPDRTPDHLDAWLERMATKGLPLYALIDVARLAEGGWAGLDAFRSPEAPQINLYDDMAGLELARTGPVLVKVADTPNARRDLAKFTVEAWAVQMLWSDTGMQAVQAHLRELREVTLPDRRQALFRFQDPSVMTALIPLLKDAQHAALLGPIQTWGTLGPCKQIRGLTRVAGLAGAASAGHLQFDSHTFNALNDALQVQTSLAQVKETDSAFLQKLDLCQQNQKAEHLLKKAKSLGLSLSEDLGLFTILGFGMQDGFEKVEPFALI